MYLLCFKFVDTAFLLCGAEFCSCTMFRGDSKLNMSTKINIIGWFMLGIIFGNNMSTPFVRCVTETVAPLGEVKAVAYSFHISTLTWI